MPSARVAAAGARGALGVAFRPMIALRFALLCEGVGASADVRAVRVAAANSGAMSASGTVSIRARFTEPASPGRFVRSLSSRESTSSHKAAGSPVVIVASPAGVSWSVRASNAMSEPVPCGSFPLSNE